MLRIILFISFLIGSFTAQSQKFKPTDAGSKVHFTIKNFGISTGGDVSGLGGNIFFAPTNIGISNFDVSVNVKTIDTDNDTRDEHLKGADYFDAEKYPLITIKSATISRPLKSATGWYSLAGTITIHGVSKPIIFPFNAIKKGDDYLFVGGFTINRLDFGIGKNSSVMSNTVKVTLSVLAKKS